MTLVIAARNKDSIVVGVDSLWQDGPILKTDGEKLYMISEDCAVMVAGYKFNAYAVGQFLRDFDPVDFAKLKRLHKVTDITEEL